MLEEANDHDLLQIPAKTKPVNYTVQIIGRGKTKKYVQYSHDKDVWAFNDNALNIPAQYLTGVFEMHPDYETRYEGIVGCEDYLPFLRRYHPFPIWMHSSTMDVPSSRRYPLESMYPIFFTGSASYALALAIYMGYERIEMYGIEAEKGTEYEKSRDALFFWMGRAEGAGIHLILHHENKLFSAPLYPFP